MVLFQVFSNLVKNFSIFQMKPKKSVEVKSLSESLLIFNYKIIEFNNFFQISCFSFFYNLKYPNAKNV